MSLLLEFCARLDSSYSMGDGLSGDCRAQWKQDNAHGAGSANTLLPLLILNSEGRGSDQQFKRPDRSDDEGRRAGALRQLCCLYLYLSPPHGLPESACPNQDVCDPHDSSECTHS